MLTRVETYLSTRAPRAHVLFGLALAAVVGGRMFAGWFATVADVRESLQQALAGRYVIERELGHGGSASVYLARDLKIPRLVALKVLTPELALAVRTERFQREIAIAARLNHPHILPLFEADAAGGFLFYTMPPVHGESLGARLSRLGRLPLDEALGIAGQIAEALEYAHGEGVIHRDIKPGNILLDSGGHVWVADFGIARAIAGEASEPLTETGSAMGTVAYMSPEQISGAVQLDGQTDVYSLGCVLYEMLVGAPPYTGPTVQSVLAKQLVDPVPSIRAARPEVPDGIARIRVGGGSAGAPGEQSSSPDAHTRRDCRRRAGVRQERGVASTEGRGVGHVAVRRVASGPGRWCGFAWRRRGNAPGRVGAMEWS